MQGRIEVRAGSAIAITIAAITAGSIVQSHHAIAALSNAGAGRSYIRAIEEAKQAGIPVTPQLLQAPLPPVDQNAAPFYTQLTDLLDNHPISKRDEIAELLTAPQMSSDEQFKRVRVALAHRADVMNLIHRAANRPECVFVRDWRYPNAIIDRESSKIREASRLLVGESALLAHNGKPLDAVKNLALGLRLARHVENDNYLIGYMTAQTIDRYTLLGLQRILYTSGEQAGVSEAIRSVIEKDWRRPDLARAFRSRAGATVVDFEVLRKLGPTRLKDFIGEKSSPVIRMSPQSWNAFIDDNGSVMLRLQREEAVAAELQYPQSFAALTEVDSEADKESSPAHILVTVYTIPDADFAQRRAELQAHVETMRVAAALLVFRSRHGSLPATLAEALTPVPLDPFDGKPLRYRKESQGFVEYSIGRNGTFTGGEPNQKPARYEADVLFRYPFPAYYAGPLKED